jgi:hypothetical protein
VVGPVYTLPGCALSVSAMAQTLMALKKKRWLVSGTTAHTVKSQEHLAAGDVVIASIAVDHTQAVCARTHSLAFLSFSADDMLLEKWHEPELLVDLAAPEIVDWQSWVVLRPRMSERKRSHVPTVEHPAIPICDCPGAALQIWKDQPD